MNEPSLDKQIYEAERLKAFLAEEVVQRAIAAIGRQAFEEFKSAKTESERALAQAKALVAEDFATALNGVLGAGEIARKMVEQKEKAASQRRGSR